jgi:hypothetical protein
MQHYIRYSGFAAETEWTLSKFMCLGGGDNGQVKAKSVCTACHKCSLFKQMVKQGIHEYNFF